MNEILEKAERRNSLDDKLLKIELELKKKAYFKEPSKAILEITNKSEMNKYHLIDKQNILIEKKNGKSWEVASAKCRFHEPALIVKTFESVLELSDADAENPKMNMYFMDGGKKLCHVLVQLKK